MNKTNKILESSIEKEIRTKNGKIKTVKLTRNMAIKCFCTECMGWEINPNDCTDIKCPLFLYRGKTLISNE